MLGRYVRFMLCIATLFCEFQPGQVRAQTFDVEIAAGVAVLGGLTLSKIFTRLENDIEQTRASFEGSANKILASAAEQAYNMLKQLKQLLDEEREKTFQQISNERKLAIWDLYNLVNKLKAGIADDFAKEMVQVHKLIGQIRFIGKDVKFLIIRIAPPVITRQTLASDPIRIIGVGFGVDQADKSFDTSISLSGKRLPDSKIAVKEWGLELAVHGEDFGATWKQSEYGRVPMMVESTITVPGSRICRWAGCKKKETFSALYHLSLYPTAPSSLVVRQRQEDTRFTGNEELVQLGIDLPNLDNPDHPAVTTGPVWGAGDGWRWVRYDKLHNACENIGGNGCPFVPESQTKCEFLADNTQVQCTAVSSGASVHYKFGIYKRRLEKVSIALPDINFTLLPGETRRIEVEKVASAAWVEGKLPFGQDFGPYSLKPAGGTATGEILCTYAGEVGNKTHFNCTMAQPW